MYYNDYYRCNPCGAQPIVPVVRADQPVESVSSQLQNLITSLFGTFPITVVNGRGTWQLPNVEVEGFTRQPDEGYIYYLFRVILALREAVAQTPYAQNIAQAMILPTVGVLPSGSVVGILNAIQTGALSFYQFDITGAPPASAPPNIFHPNDNPNGTFTLIS